MIELMAHLTYTELPSFWLAFFAGFAAGGTAVAGLWRLRAR